MNPTTSSPHHSKRITYYWPTAVLHTALWTAILISLLVISFQYLFLEGGIKLKGLLAVNLLFIPVASIFIGLRPILGLFVVPDTLYRKGEKLLLRNSEEIEIKNIKKVYVHRIGFGSNATLYYQINLKESPELIVHRKRKFLVAVEPYRIQNLFQERTDLLNHFYELGLAEGKVQWQKKELKQILGFGQKFKE